MLDNFEGKKDISWNAFFVQEYHVYGLASEHDAKTLKNMLLNVHVGVEVVEELLTDHIGQNGSH